jgi:thioredoxin reductase (NADPH)
VFVFAGYAPDTDFLNGVVNLNDKGYIITDSQQKTNMEGVYAAGDVCIKSLRQVVTATGDGALAATELEKHVAIIQRKTGIAAKQPIAKEYKAEEQETPIIKKEDSNELFSNEMKTQLRSVFDKIQRKVILKLYLDERTVSAELENYMRTLASLSNNITVEIAQQNASSSIAPCVKICLNDGTETGLAFHGVPGGHEFTSFILGIYNTTGTGQTLDEETKKLIESVTQPTDIKVLVSLSCTMCPDTVVAAQHIAAKNPNVTAEIYDVQHFDEIKKRYNIMSVPCIVINDSKVFFGKKNIRQIIELF